MGVHDAHGGLVGQGADQDADQGADQGAGLDGQVVLDGVPHHAD